jgi:hypothetical protein
MTERPILFSAPMVRAILDGRKTQTRRIVKPLLAFPAVGRNDIGQHGADWWIEGPGDSLSAPFRCPYGVPGDALWVREEFSGHYAYQGLPPRVWKPGSPIWWGADGEPQAGDWTKPKPSIHMPRWASRIALRVTDVRVERLAAISERDARAEGIQTRGLPDWPEYRGADDLPWRFEFPRDAYEDLWEAINGPGSWAANPWVWVVTFERAS